MVQLCGWGKMGWGFFFFFHSAWGQCAIAFWRAIILLGSTAKGPAEWGLFHILYQPGMRFFLSGVEPKNGIDIKMHQPGSAFPLLTDFFLIPVFYG